jgi:DnaK suppressor protein
VPSPKKTEHFRELLETRIAELEAVAVGAQRETRVNATKHADPADQAASEYERQALIHKAAAAQQTLITLKQALERLRQGSFGECAECGGPTHFPNTDNTGRSITNPNRFAQETNCMIDFCATFRMCKLRGGEVSSA